MRTEGARAARGICSDSRRGGGGGAGSEARRQLAGEAGLGSVSPAHPRVRLSPRPGGPRRAPSVPPTQPSPCQDTACPHPAFRAAAQGRQVQARLQLGSRRKEAHRLSPRSPDRLASPRGSQLRAGQGQAPRSAGQRWSGATEVGPPHLPPPGGSSNPSQGTGPTSQASRLPTSQSSGPARLPAPVSRCTQLKGAQAGGHWGLPSHSLPGALLPWHSIGGQHLLREPKQHVPQCATKRTSDLCQGVLPLVLFLLPDLPGPPATWPRPQGGTLPFASDKAPDTCQLGRGACEVSLLQLDRVMWRQGWSRRPPKQVASTSNSAPQLGRSRADKRKSLCHHAQHRAWHTGTRQMEVSFLQSPGISKLSVLGLQSILESRAKGYGRR